MPRLIMVIDCPPTFNAENRDAQEFAKWDVLPPSWRPRLISAHWSDPDTPEPPVKCRWCARCQACGNSDLNRCSCAALSDPDTPEERER